ncbi:MAG: hypothetical protein U1D30_26495 [Planctomycetota bacterium]
MLILTETDRTRTLREWVRRVLENRNPPAGAEQRRVTRNPSNCEVHLTPIESHSLQPLTESRISVVAKDESDLGIGVVTDGALDGDLFFGEFIGRSGVFLARVVRQRTIHGKVIEYGMQILDRYDSLDELKS